MIVWVNAGWFRPQAIAEAADLQTISDQQVVVPLLLLFLAARRSDLPELPRPPESIGNRHRLPPRPAGRWKGKCRHWRDRITEMAMAALPQKARRRAQTET
jgi:hypothetical protein